ncbi:MAG: M48 family metallopeptidase [Gemmatales bacterium]|nr:M48 family metallopeptidase [Gemmatales bacterium]MDW7993914.1 M48 family metallopeptidase [Gemmatales bacterium]
MSALVTFRDLIAANRRKSAWLVAGFCLFTTVALTGLSLGILALAAPDAFAYWDWRQTLVLALGAAAISGLIAWLALYRGDKFLLFVSGAQPIRKEDDPQLYNVVEEVAIAAGIPPPPVYLIDDTAMNAFATGRDPQHAAVAITRGLREKLTRDELQGVIAHEIAHIRNYDIRLMMLLAVLIGTIAVLADVFLHMLRFAGHGRSHSRREQRKSGAGGNAGVVIVILVAIILALLAPLVAQIIQLAVSRQREYLADATAVELTRNPHGILGALRKLAGDTEELEVANRGTAHMYFVNPIRKYAARGNSIFASHPPIEERIRRLEQLLV